MTKPLWSDTVAYQVYLRERRELKDVVSHYRDSADGCLYCGIPIVEMRRDELLAVLAMLISQKTTTQI